MLVFIIFLFLLFFRNIQVEYISQPSFTEIVHVTVFWQVICGWKWKLLPGQAYKTFRNILCVLSLVAWMDAEVPVEDSKPQCSLQMEETWVPKSCKRNKKQNKTKTTRGLAIWPVCEYRLRTPHPAPLTTDRLHFSEGQGRSHVFFSINYLVNDLVSLVGIFTVFRSQVKFTSPPGIPTERTSHKASPLPAAPAKMGRIWPLKIDTIHKSLDLLTIWSSSMVYKALSLAQGTRQEMTLGPVSCT